MKKFALASIALALTLSAYAADASGKWKGKISMDLSGFKAMVKQKAASVPADKKAQVTQQLAAMDQAEKMMAKAVISMELKKDGSVVMNQTMNGKSEGDTGKWTQSGNKVKITGMNAKKGGPKEMTGSISSNGKGLLFDLSADMKKQAAKQGAPAGTSGKLILSFTKA